MTEEDCFVSLYSLRAETAARGHFAPHPVLDGVRSIFTTQYFTLPLPVFFTSRRHHERLSDEEHG